MANQGGYTRGKIVLEVVKNLSPHPVGQLVQANRKSTGVLKFFTYQDLALHSLESSP